MNNDIAFGLVLGIMFSAVVIVAAVPLSTTLRSWPRYLDARQEVADMKIRRKFFEWLWQFHPDAGDESKDDVSVSPSASVQKCRTPRPCPVLDDERIKENLKRIFGG